MIFNELSCTSDEQVEIIDVILEDENDNTTKIENEEDTLGIISGNVLVNINNKDYEKDNYIPVDGLEIELYNYKNLNAPIDKVKPDNQGFYEFKNLDVDDYILKLYLPNNYELLEENDKNFINKQLLISKKINNQNNIDIPIKLKKTFSVKGVVFLDKSQSSTYDKGSIGINGIKISLLDEEDKLIKQTTTKKFLSIDGFFDFNNLDSNVYKIVLKIEDELEIYNFTKELKPSKRLKICTLKVSDKYKKLGTKYLKIALTEAIKNNVNEIYITLYTNHKDLINLLEKNNYKYYCDNTNNEKVYVNKIKEF